MDCCAICLELLIEDVVELGCKHRLHLECAVDYFVSRGTLKVFCPYCVSIVSNFHRFIVCEMYSHAIHTQILQLKGELWTLRRTLWGMKLGSIIKVKVDVVKREQIKRRAIHIKKHIGVLKSKSKRACGGF